MYGKVYLKKYYSFFTLSIVIMICLACVDSNKDEEKDGFLSTGYDFGIENEKIEIKDFDGNLYHASVDNNLKHKNKFKLHFNEKTSSHKLEVALNIKQAYRITVFKNGIESYKTIILPSQLQAAIKKKKVDHDLLVLLGELNAITTYFTLKSENLHGINSSNAEQKIRFYLDHVLESDITDFSELNFDNFNSGKQKFNELYEVNKNRINLLNVFLGIIDNSDELNTLEKKDFNYIYRSIPNSLSTEQLSDFIERNLKNLPDNDNFGEKIIESLRANNKLFVGSHLISPVQLSNIFWKNNSTYFLNLPINSYPNTSNRIPDSTGLNENEYLAIDSDGGLVWKNLEIDLNNYQVTDFSDIQDSGSMKIISDKEREMLNDMYQRSLGNDEKENVKFKSPTMLDTGNLSQIDNAEESLPDILYGYFVSPNMNMKLNFFEIHSEVTGNCLLTAQILDQNYMIISSGNIQVNKIGFTHIYTDATVDLTCGSYYYFAFSTNVSHKFSGISNLTGYRTNMTFRWKTEFEKNSKLKRVIKKTLKPSKKHFWLRGGFRK